MPKINIYLPDILWLKRTLFYFAWWIGLGKSLNQRPDCHSDMFKWIAEKLMCA
jgi:hypothetical protein